MNPPLSPLEQRVLGSLIEKDMATPDYYPLSVNSLMTACNQKTNREPVSDYDEDTVRDGLGALEERDLAEPRYDSRVPKYAHRVSYTLNLNNRELALLCVLLLRGPQTLNELKDRTQRMYAFDDLDAVENSLKKMSERAEPLTVFLGRQPGQREPRWMHLMGGPVTAETLAEMAAPAPHRAARTEDLEIRVNVLEAELHELKEQFAAFRRQFES
ncbi:MAG: YceH family protein [Bryobacterales bacterium]|nr:YceH family protein [Bryobacterales bacterium]